MGSDSQGMGRIGETVARTWQLASHMKATRGALAGDEGTGADNARILRYIAKLTINPARLFGIDHEIGTLADVVARSGDWQDRQVLIAGSPQMIENTRRTLIIAGVRASRIQHDPVF